MLPIGEPVDGPAAAALGVVGGGVVGCAVLRELTVHLGWRVLLVEASPHLAAGASSGNTGIACTASDVAPGTLVLPGLLFKDKPDR